MSHEARKVNSLMLAAHDSIILPLNINEIENTKCEEIKRSLHRKNLDVLFIALLMSHLAASAELLQKLCCNCCLVNVF